MGPLSSSYFLAQVTSVLGGGQYAFVEAWLNPAGSVVQKAAGRFGSAENPGYAVDGSTFAAGAVVLCRSADGAGGLLWELSALGTASGSGPSFACSTSSPTAIADITCIGGTQYITRGNLSPTGWCNLETTSAGCCTCGTGSSATPTCSGSGSASTTEPVVLMLPVGSGCASVTMTGVVTAVNATTWEGTITGGGLSGTAQLQQLTNGNYRWAAVVTTGGGALASFSGDLTASGSTLSGSSTATNFGACTGSPAAITVYGDPCAGSGSGSGSSGSGASGSGVAVVCCTAGTVPSTIYMTFSAPPGSLTCLNGTKWAFDYGGASQWNMRTYTNPCTGQPTTLSFIQCALGARWDVAIETTGGCNAALSGTAGGDCTGNTLFSGTLTFSGCPSGSTANFVVTKT